MFFLLKNYRNIKYPQILIDLLFLNGHCLTKGFNQIIILSFSYNMVTSDSVVAEPVAPN